MQRSALVVALVAMCASRVAGADVDPSPGPFVDFAIGAGYSADKYTADGLAQPSSESATVAAPTIALTLTHGWSWSTFAVGPMLDATVVAAESRLGHESKSSWWILSASLALAWKPKAQGIGPEAMFGLGYASAQGLFGTTQGLDGPGRTNGFESTGGPRLAARYGFVWPGGLGIAATVWGAYLLSEHAKYVPLGATIQGTVSSW